MSKSFEKAVSNLEEERVYEAISIEIAEGSVKAGLWTKAIAEADGNEGRIESIYIRLRFQNIVDEILVKKEQENRDAEKKNRAKERENNQKAEVESKLKRQGEARESRPEQYRDVMENVARRLLKHGGYSTEYLSFFNAGAETYGFSHEDIVQVAEEIKKK